MILRPGAILALISIFLLGLRHGVDYDHIAAITDITAARDSEKGGMTMGLLYAFGHALVIFILGSAAVLFGAHLPAGTDVWMEKIVGITLIALGGYVAHSLITRRENGQTFMLATRLEIVTIAYIWLRTRLQFRDARSSVGAIEHPHPRQYGGKSAFAVGMIHGIGAETPTQMLFFIFEAGIGGAGAGMLGVMVFIGGLLVSNTALCAISVGFFSMGRHSGGSRILAGVTALYSVCVGMMFLLGISSLLPPLQ